MEFRESLRWEINNVKIVAQSSVFLPSFNERKVRVPVVILDDEWWKPPLID